jgi:hypothetical protein
LTPLAFWRVGRRPVARLLAEEADQDAARASAGTPVREAF